MHLSKTVERNSDLRDRPHSQIYVVATVIGFAIMFTVAIVGMICMYS